MFKNIRRVFGRTSHEDEDKIPATIDVDSDGDANCHLNDVQVLVGHKDLIRVMIKIDEKRFATASDDSTIIIWDGISGKRLKILEGHSLPVNCLLLLQTSKEEPPVLVSGSTDKTIKMWDLETGTYFADLKAHDGSVKCLANLEGGSFCSGGNDDYLFIWSKEGKQTGKILRKESDNLHCLLPIRNNRLVSASDGSLLVYNLSSFSFHRSLSAPHARAHREAVRCLCQVSDSLFASASLDGAIILWTTHTLSPLRTLNCQLSYQDQELHVFTYSVQHMVSCGDRYILAAIGCGFSLFDALTGDCLLKCAKAHHTQVQYVTTLYQGERILTCSTDSLIRVWAPDSLTISTGSPLKPQTVSKTELPAHISKLDVFIPRQPRATNRAMCVGELALHSDTVSSLLPMTDYSFVSCGFDGMVILWKDSLIETYKKNEQARKFVEAYEMSFSK